MKYLRLLGEDKVKRLHEATLSVLSDIGILLNHDKAKELLISYGAEEKNGRILIPEDTVEKAIGYNSDLILKGREKEICLGSDNTYVHNVGGVPDIYEIDGKRPAIRKDNIDAVRLMDSLKNISSITPHFTPQDVNPEHMKLWMYYDTVCNTLKPIRGPGLETAVELEKVSKMKNIASEDSILVASTSPISPLKFPDNIVDTILLAAENNIPLNPLPCPTMGLTAPMSLAGGLVQQNAEVLSAIVIARLLNPELPVVYRGRLSLMDPYTADSSWKGPEIGLISAATVELGRFYGMPTNVYGFCTESKGLDADSICERTLNAILPVLAGAAEISGVGELDGGNLSSLAQIVIDDEIMGKIYSYKDVEINNGKDVLAVIEKVLPDNVSMNPEIFDNIERVVEEGIEVSDDELALDVIRNVVCNSSDYIIEEHTARYLRKGELLPPNLDKAIESKGFDVDEFVSQNDEKAKDLINSYNVPGLSSEKRKLLKDIILGL